MNVRYVLINNNAKEQYLKRVEPVFIDTKSELISYEEYLKENSELLTIIDGCEIYRLR